jgi:DNA polymerase III subunit gamma/tau
MDARLHLKYRPRRFDEVLGQGHIPKRLRVMAATGRVATAVWFLGPRGTGKTSCARILAAALNCDLLTDGEPCGRCRSCTDILSGGRLGGPYSEVNAAGQGRVDDIRREVDRLRFKLGYMVLALDEADKMTSPAASTLQSQIEEPAQGVLFVLVSNEVGTITEPMQDRCIQLKFKRIPDQIIVERIQEVAKLERIPASPKLVQAIVRQAKGSLRGALNALEDAAGDPDGFLEMRADHDSLTQPLERLLDRILSSSAPKKHIDVAQALIMRAIATNTLTVPYSLSEIETDADVAHQTAVTATKRWQELGVTEKVGRADDGRSVAHQSRCTPTRVARRPSKTRLTSSLNPRPTAV